MARIELSRASIRFSVRQARRITLKEFLVRRMFRQSVNPAMEVDALRDITLSVHEGDRLGIIGPNGAGKSTMLKLIAGIYPPTSGKRVVEGRISSLFDIALGFEPDASGYENIKYRGFLQGETPRTLRKKIDDIAAFSELGRFLDMPVRYYSAGMHVKLAFSIATAVEPEVLLVDEVLSVGDMAFQQKARQRMMDMMGRARVIVMVSHDLNSLANFCDRGIVLDQGTVVSQGTMQEAIQHYKGLPRNTPQAA
jgi:ABC-type polysaccharide/polyol phosphate transport system ATPase subunit